ncbi:hypothetical protein BT69DRAFT_1282978 [Atractiella rhizophila]|nr:hypothetical protein BT69DRAFT_1282978 [Atractiella rhizophila]
MMTVMPERRSCASVILDDVLVWIFSSLSDRRLARCCSVCWSWNALAQPMLNRGRVFTLSLLGGDHDEDQEVQEQQSRLIHPSNIRDVRHLVLLNEDATKEPVTRDNSSCVLIFEILQEVGPYLTSPQN